MAELSDAAKQVFKDATDRRKAAGIRLKRFSVMADESQVAALNELFDDWVLFYGKQKAVDSLIRVMAAVTRRRLEIEEGRQNKNARPNT